MAKHLRSLVVGVLLGTLFLAVPLAQTEYIRQIAGGVLFGTGDARPVLFGNDGKGYIKVDVGGAISTINSASWSAPLTIGPLAITSTAVTSSVPFTTTGAASDIASARDVTASRYFINSVDGSGGGYLLGSTNDVHVFRGAANRLDLASGDSFYLVSGGLGVGAANTTAGTIQSSGGATFGSTVSINTAGSNLNIGERISIRPSDLGKVEFTNNAVTAGIGFDFATDGTLKIRNRAQNADADITAANVGASGNIYAGASGLIYWATGSQMRSGSGSPEGVITAGVGSTWHRTDGGAGTSFYVKESGTGNTGWVAK